MITKGADNFGMHVIQREREYPVDVEFAVLDGANPSAEGEDADEGGDGGDNKKILDMEDQFRLNKIEGGLDKKAFTSDVKGAAKLPSHIDHVPLLTAPQLTSRDSTTN